MAIDRSPVVAVSTFVVDAPPTVYQTRLVDGKQDNSSPQIFRVQLSASTFKAVVAAGAPLSDSIFGVIRRSDGREVEVFDEDTASYLGLRLPQATFEYSLTKRGVLEIRVHRKELPVSIAHSFSPFKLVFAVGKPSAGPPVELIETSPFMIASKEPKPRPARPPPKRVRAPPPRRPVAAPAVGREAEITQLLSGVAVPTAAPATAPAAQVAEVDDMEVVPRKRGRKVVAAPAPIAVLTPAPAASAAPPSPIAAILADSAIASFPSPFGLDFDIGAAIAAEFSIGAGNASPMDAVVLPLAL